MKLRILKTCFIPGYPEFREGLTLHLPDDIAKLLIERSQAEEAKEEVKERKNKADKAAKTE